MVNVSEKGLSSKMITRLFKQFARVATSTNSQRANAFFIGFFTEKEHIVFAKRMAIILMLYEGYSHRSIAQLLSASRMTVVSIAEQYEEGKYDAVIHVVARNKEEREKMWQTIDLVLRAGLPLRGKDRWKWLDKHK